MTIDQSISSPAASQKSEKLDPVQKAKLQKAVREFESVFVGYMLKSMRNTVEKSDNSTDSFGGDMLESLFDVELAKHISKNSNLGIADMLYRKMTGEKLLPHVSPVTQNNPGPSGKLERNVDFLKNSVPVKKAPGVDSASIVSNKTSLVDRLRNYESYVAEASEKFGVKDSLIKAVIAAESSARPDAQSPKNAKGLMQLIDSTAAEMGVKNVWDPRENILGGAKYLKQLLERHDGNETLALASYNAGPGAVKKHGGVPPFSETKHYVARVIRLMNVFQQQETSNE
ncbi:MAG: transglycosylase SLT domain-containing protein [Bacteroidetes bacterium]|nr:transglycosylase SLT domain-containing protein [Bacteroidota bacterium]MCW5895084.1 transglycosylase SLT domain-containing protein [Bacteroidota bacterium]